MSDVQRYPYMTHPTGGSVRMVLVRHGRTHGNVQRLLQGRIDLPLDVTGRAQAEQAAAHLAERFSLDAIVSSPLQRAHDTARQIADRFGLPIDLEDDLQEMHFGDFEGRPLEHVIAEYPDLGAKAMDPGSGDLRWPNGESRSEFHDRVRRVFTRLAEDYDGRRVAVISHNGVLGSFLAHVQGASPNKWGAYRLENCSVSWLDVEQDGTTVHGVNMCDHLVASVAVANVAGGDD
jgi:broad specificity phosphatase PhoE